MDSAPPHSLSTQRAMQRVGRVLRDKWRLESVLGTGGFGAVYAATHRTGKRVAIKILHPELSVVPEARSRFLREAYAVNAVSHPGMVSVLDDDVDEEGCVFLVMELLEGETLEARRGRAGGSLDFDDVLSLADQMLDVLAKAHEMGVVHRDLKPENVFLLNTGQLKLLDFGVAKLREAPRGKALTAQGIVIGTPAFMPPEQARGQWEMVDERSDLWSVGATIFTLLTGQLVHGNLTPQESLIACVTKPAPRLAEVSPGVPRALAALVDKALAFERADRFQSAKLMQEAVREVYHELTGGLASTAPHEAASIEAEHDDEGVRVLPGADDEPTAVISRPLQKLLAARRQRPSSTTAKSPGFAAPDSEPTIVEAPPSMTIRQSATGLVPAELRENKLASIFDSADFGDQSQWSAAVKEASASLNAQAAQAAQAARAATKPAEEGAENASSAPGEHDDATIPVHKDDPGQTAVVLPKSAVPSRSRRFVLWGLVFLVVLALVATFFVARRVKRQRGGALLDTPRAPVVRVFLS